MHEKRCECSWWEDNKEMGLYYTFTTSGMNYEVAQNIRVSLNEKRKSNLKLLKDKILWDNKLLLFTFVLFS